MILNIPTEISEKGPGFRTNRCSFVKAHNLILYRHASLGGKTMESGEQTTIKTPKSEPSACFLHIEAQEDLQAVGYAVPVACQSRLHRSSCTRPFVSLAVAC